MTTKGRHMGGGAREGVGKRDLETESGIELHVLLGQAW